MCNVECMNPSNNIWLPNLFDQTEKAAKMLMLIAKCFNSITMSQTERSCWENYMKVYYFMKAGVYPAVYNSNRKIQMEHFSDI